MHGKGGQEQQLELLHQDQGRLGIKCKISILSVYMFVLEHKVFPAFFGPIY